MDLLRKSFDIIECKTIDSTNDEAIRMIKQNQIQQKTIILSNEQTKGRGKENAIWTSPIGNIYMTLIFLVDDIKKYNDFQNLSLVVGLSLHDVIIANRNHELNIRIKKPNDILINEKKVAGILPEVIFHNNIYYINIGIGINWSIAPLETSDFINQFISIEKNEFIVKISHDIDEKLKNFLFYNNKILNLANF